MAVSPNHVVIKNARLSYASVWEPKSFGNDDSNPKYSVSLIISKGDTAMVEKINAAIKYAYEKGKDRLKGNGSSVPPFAKVNNPLRDGDEDRPDDAAYKGCWFISANSSSAPAIVDGFKNPIMDKDQVYSGCYCNVGVDFYAYSHLGNKGIAAGLGNIQKIRDGERFDGRATIDDDFEVEEDDPMA